MGTEIPMKRYFMGAALAIAGLLIGWTVWKTPSFESRPKPAVSFEQALGMFEKLRASESSLSLSPEGASRLLHHGRKTKRAFVLLHGLTNCPEQFAKLAAQIHSAGHNVIVPRARLAGFRDRLNGKQGLQTAQDLIDQAAAGLDIAAGLGNQVTLVGLSGSAVAAAWLAQNREGMDEVAILAPFFGVYGMPVPLADFAGAVLSKLPNFYVWWDPDNKESLVGPPHAYPRFGTRCMADCLQLSLNVRTNILTKPPHCRRVLVITTACDIAANNSLTHSITQNLAAQSGPAEILAYEFPADLKIPHDMIDPAQPGAKTTLVYTKLLDLLGDGAPTAHDP